MHSTGSRFFRTVVFLSAPALATTACMPAPQVNDTLPLEVIFDDDPASQTVATFTQPGLDLGATFFGTKAEDGTVVAISGVTGQTSDGSAFSAGFDDGEPTSLEIGGLTLSFADLGSGGLEVTIDSTVPPAGQSSGGERSFTVSRILEADQIHTRLAQRLAGCGGCTEQEDLWVLLSAARLFVVAVSARYGSCFQGDEAGPEECAMLGEFLNSFAALMNGFIDASADLPEEFGELFFDDEGVRWPRAPDWSATEGAAEACGGDDFPASDGITLLATGGYFRSSVYDDLEYVIPSDASGLFTVDPSSIYLDDGTEFHWALSASEAAIAPQLSGNGADSALVTGVGLGTVQLCVWGTEPVTGALRFKASRTIVIEPRILRITEVDVEGDPAQGTFTLCLDYAGNVVLPARIGVFAADCPGASCPPAFSPVSSAEADEVCAEVESACLSNPGATVSLVAFLEDTSGATSNSIVFSYTCP